MNGWVWSIGEMVLTGENWSTGTETLYSVGGRWMDGYGALVEWYWQGKTEVLGEKHYIVWVVGEWMGMEHWWNGTDRGNLKYWERNPSQYHFVHHKSHMDLSGIEPMPPLWGAGDWPPKTLQDLQNWREYKNKLLFRDEHVAFALQRSATWVAV